MILFDQDFFKLFDTFDKLTQGKDRKNYYGKKENKPGKRYVNYLYKWEKTLVNGQGHWKREPNWTRLWKDNEERNMKQSHKQNFRLEWETFRRTVSNI